MRVSFYASEKDNRPTVHDLTWSALVDVLSRHRLGPCTLTDCVGKKCPHKLGASWSPVNIEGTRANRNVHAVTAAVFDLDGVTDDTWIERIRGYSIVIYSTHTHRDESPSLRLVLELSRAVHPSEWYALWPALVERFGLPADQACKDPSRLYFMPTASIGAPVIAMSAIGTPVDVDAVLAQALPADVEPTRGPSEDVGDLGPASGAVLAEVQRFLREHGPAVQGKGGDQHTYRACAIAVNDFALSEREALSVLSVWDADNDPPWGESGLLEKMENSTRYAQNERGGARRAFVEQRSFAKEFATPKSDAEEPEPGSWEALLAKAKREILDVLANTPGNGSAPNPLFEASTDILRRPHASTPWLVKGLMTKGPGSITLLGGEAKTSKTWAELEIFIACATGTKAFGEFETGVPIYCALFLAEDGEAAYATRVTALVAGRAGGMSVEEATARIYVQPRGRTLDLLKIDDIALIVASCWATGNKIELVGLDPLSDIHEGEEDKRDSMAVVMRHARAIGTILKAGVFLVHHMGKPSDGGSKRTGGQKLRGSGAVYGSLDSGIFIVNPKSPDGRTKFESRVESKVKAGRSAGFFDLTLTIEDDDDGQATKAVWKYTDGKPEEAAKDDDPSGLDARILVAVASGHTSVTSIRSVVKGKGASSTSISDAVLRLVHSGRLHRPERDENGMAIADRDRRYQITAPKTPTVAPRVKGSIGDRFGPEE